MSLPNIDKLRQIALIERQRIHELEIQKQQKINLSEEIIKRKNEADEERLQLYKEVVEYIKKQMTTCAEQGLTKCVIVIRTPSEIFTSKDNCKFKCLVNGYIDCRGIFINRKMLTEVVYNLQQEQYIVNYLAPLNSMKGINIEW
jgi:hypothetical protein